MNTKPKYVASTTLTEPRWADTTVLSGDLAAAIGELKAKPGGELQVHGSGALTRWLLENDLVDEIILLIVPVVLGQGTRLFPDTGPDIALDLVESRADPKGITIQVYRPAGRPQYATLKQVTSMHEPSQSRPVTYPPTGTSYRSSRRPSYRGIPKTSLTGHHTGQVSYRVRAAHEGRRTTGDDPRCSTWFP